MRPLGASAEHMPSEARAILQTLSPKELRAFAKETGADVSGCRSKADLVNRLSDFGPAQAALAAPAYQVRPSLAAMTPSKLRGFAADHGLDVTGAKTKADLIGRIAASPAAEELQRAPTGGVEPSPRVDLGHDVADPLILQGRNEDVDLGLVDEILDQARMRFEERNYDRSLELAREAILLAHGTLDAFGRAAWAYALLAAQRLIEESGRTGHDVQPAAALLRDAKVAYASGNLAANEGLLRDLQSATKALFSEEMQHLRESIYGAEDRIGQGKHLGADVGPAEEALSRAKDAMRRAEHAEARRLVAETTRLAAESLVRRVREIEGMVPATEKAIEEARNLGADVDEAGRLLEKAKVALQRGEHVLAVELVQRAERSTLQSQHYQIQRAMELRLRQIERAQKLVNYLVPIADEAAGYDMPIEDVRRFLADAKDVLDQGDYVNGTVLAKQAEERLRSLVPHLVEERTRRGVKKPPMGRCGTCDSGDVAFLDDGWARCDGCGATWRWRAPSGLWERFRSLLRE